MSGAFGAAVLTVDLGALAGNWRRLQQQAGGATCAAVLKADAYGTGIDAVAPALLASGCRCFFVAQPNEGENLRRLIGAGPEIFVLNGAPRGGEHRFLDADLLPVLNGLDDIRAWHRAVGGAPAAVHLDTGMTRLGLSPEEVAELAADTALLSGLSVRLWMSHLACAETPNEPKNRQQLKRFCTLLDRLPAAPASLANSSGVFLGGEYLFDMVRPGIALFGGNPTPDRPSPVLPVVQIDAPIIQIHHVDSPETVGYGAAHRIQRPSRIATVPVGYADGYLRSLSGRGYGMIDGCKIPVIGRISMDLTTFDVTDVTPAQSGVGATITLLGGGVDLDELASKAGTISYELLTALGQRYHRVYRSDADRDDTV